jgi:hypothetical protein
MQSYEVPEDQWLEFFDRFSREHTGWPVTLEVLSGDLGPQRLAHDLPLQGISFDAKGTRACALEVGAGDKPGENYSHRVDLPLHIRVADDPNGGTIQIEPAQGPQTLVHFRRPFPELH